MSCSPKASTSPSRSTNHIPNANRPELSSGLSLLQPFAGASRASSQSSSALASSAGASFILLGLSIFALTVIAPNNLAADVESARKCAILKCVAAMRRRHSRPRTYLVLVLALTAAAVIVGGSVCRRIRRALCRIPICLTRIWRCLLCLWNPVAKHFNDCIVFTPHAVPRSTMFLKSKPDCRSAMIRGHTP